MEAVVWRAYGPPEVLRLERLPVPVPREDEVLVRVHASTVTSSDALMRRGESAAGRIVVGLRRPRRRYRIPGLELSGTVEAVGRRVTRYGPGDEVFGFTGFRLGAHAEYACLPERGSLAIKPPNVSHSGAAALVDGATTALYFLRDRAGVRPGQALLVVGASGSVGGYAVQLARYLGAEVTGVAGTRNQELIRSLGAHRVVDYTQEDPYAPLARYDVVFDAIGAAPFTRCRRALTARGRYLTTVPGPVSFAQSLWTRVVPGRRVVQGMSLAKAEALATVRALAEDGVLHPLIDRSYPLHRIAEAHRYVDRGHKRGNVVLRVDRGEAPSGDPAEGAETVRPVLPGPD